MSGGLLLGIDEGTTAVNPVWLAHERSRRPASQFAPLARVTAP